MLTFLGVLAITGSFAAVVFWARRILSMLDVRERQWHEREETYRKAWAPGHGPDATSSAAPAYDYGAAYAADSSPSSDCSSSSDGGGGCD